MSGFSGTIRRKGERGSDRVSQFGRIFFHWFGFLFFQHTTGTTKSLCTGTIDLLPDAHEDRLPTQK